MCERRNYRAGVPTGANPEGSAPKQSMEVIAIMTIEKCNAAQGQETLGERRNYRAGIPKSIALVSILRSRRCPFFRSRWCPFFDRDGVPPSLNSKASPVKTIAIAILPKVRRSWANEEMIASVSLFDRAGVHSSIVPVSIFRSRWCPQCVASCRDRR